MAPSHPILDIHTHLYPPAYLDLLRSRSTVPYLLDLPSPQPSRLIILPNDDDRSLPANQRGRPLSPSFSLPSKIAFMKTHKIKHSTLSLANPWLDFLSPEEGPIWARRINDDINTICTSHPSKLTFFGTLPLSAFPPTIIAEIYRLQTLPACKGIILSTAGLGSGLDSSAMGAIWSTLAETRTLVFLHPHYGLPNSVYGPRAAEYGHVLSLALGFPLETTIAFTRLFLSGAFDRFPSLRILIAHAGGVVPFLAGRIDSCVLHERHFLPSADEERKGPRKSLKEVMKTNIWLDAVVYDRVGVRAAVGMVGVERVLWGSDHPFFPPLEEQEGKDEGEMEWASVGLNVEAVERAFEGKPGDKDEVEGVLGDNAARLLGVEGWRVDWVVEGLGRSDG